MHLSMFLPESLTVSLVSKVALGSLCIFLFLYALESLYTRWTLRAFRAAGSGSGHDQKWFAWFWTSFRAVFKACEIVDDAYFRVIPHSDYNPTF